MFPFSNLFPLLASTTVAFLLLLALASIALPGVRAALLGALCLADGAGVVRACGFKWARVHSWRGAGHAVAVGALFAGVFLQSGFARAATPKPTPLAGSRAYSWGNNALGQLGDDSRTGSNVPVAVATSGILNDKTVIQVAVGGYHSLALCSDGTFVSWGSNQYGQLGNVNTSDSNVPVLVARFDGRGNPTPLNGKTVVQFAAGGYHSIALCSDGTVLTWGYNSFGELGNGNTTNSNLPVEVVKTGALNNKTVVQVAAGQYFCVALCSDGTLVSWGINSFGQLGSGTNSDSNVPVEVVKTGALNNKTVVQVAAGGGHSLALCSDGTLVTWGFNGNGQLGNNSTTASNVPVTVVTTSGVSALSGKTVTQVAVGSSHCLALCSDGTVAVWGRNSDGQLGTGNTTHSSVPVLVSTSAPSALSGKTVVEVAGGLLHSVALCSDGTLASWGANYAGQLGNNSTNPSSVPVLVVSNGALSSSKVVRLMQGSVGEHTLVVATPFNSRPVIVTNIALRVTQNAPQTSITSAYLKATDDNNDTVTYTVTTVPTQGVLKINGLALVANDVFTQDDIDAGKFSFTPRAGAVIGPDGFNFSISDGKGGIRSGRFVIYISGAPPATGAMAYSWGRNSNGQLGRSTPDASTSDPGAVSTGGVLSGKTVVQLAAGDSHSVALCSDGTVAAWGYNDRGQLGNGNTGSSSSSPVLVSSSGASALSGKTVTQVAAGQSYSVALCSDGTVVTWGDNDYGQLGNNSTTPSNVPVAVVTNGVLNGKTVTQVATGGNHCLALLSDGTVVSWGYNGEGQLGIGTSASLLEGNMPFSTVPVRVATNGALSGKSVVQVAAGEYHSMALCSDGSVATWAFNSYGQLGTGNNTDSLVPILVTTSGGSALNGRVVRQIVAGGYHSVVLCSDGSVVSWGRNTDGQLGNNGSADSNVPVLVSTSGASALNGKTVTELAAGGSHSLALCDDGAVVAWGWSIYGQLGNGSTTGSAVPVLASTSGALRGKTVVRLMQGSLSNHTLVIATLNANQPPVIVTNIALRVGQNAGQTPITNAYLKTTDANGDTLTYTVTALPTQGVLKINGLALVAGDVFTQDDIDAGKFSFTPKAGAVIGSDKFTFSVSDGKGESESGTFLIYIATDTPASGSLAYSWGSNNNGQLGNNSTANSNVPVAVLASGALSDKTVTQMAAGGFHSLALCSDGTVAAWGANGGSQLGTGNRTDSTVPVPVSTSDASALNSKKVVQVAAGAYHSLALCSDGTLVSWGFNDYGQLGNGNTTASNVPIVVDTNGALKGKTVVQVGAGSIHSLALCSDGTVVAWGYNGNGQLGNNDTTNSNVPVAVVTSGASALNNKTVTQIATGAYHSLALCSDGALVAWGSNEFGQLGNNSTTQATVPVLVSTSGASALSGKTVAQMAAGNGHSLALCSDGTLASWGFNQTGQLGTGSTTNSNVPVAVLASGASALSGRTVTQVAAGSIHSLALCSDGTLASWGANGSGQLGNESTTGSNVPVLVVTSGALSGKKAAQLMLGSINDHTLVIATPGNNAPLIATNTGLRVAQNAGQTSISNAQLRAADADGDTLTYTLSAVPARGVLKLNGTTLSVNGTFTQADIDGGLLSFTPSANAQLGADGFTFSVSDGKGGSIATTSFAITITEASSLVVTRTDDVTADDGKTSLREALAYARTLSGTPTITFDATVFAEAEIITLTQGQLVLDHNVIISGTTGSNGVSVSGGNTSRVFLVGAGVTATVSNLSIISGRAAGSIFPDNAGGAFLNNGTLVLARCTLAGNYSFNGGALYSEDGRSVTLSNCTLAGNYSEGSGGAIYNTAGTLIVANSTIAGNTARDMGAGILQNNSNGTSTVSNTIIAGNSASSSPDVWGAFTSGGYNLIGNAAGSTGFTATGDQSGTSESPLSAGLNALGLYGGPTATFSFNVTSPAYNAGDPAFDTTNTPTDQRGLARVFDGRLDIGAFELVPGPLAPRVVSVTPVGATDAVETKRTFTLSVSDGNGAGDISEMWLLINTELDWSGGATLAYFPKSGELYLRRGDSFIGPIKIGRAAGASDVLDNGALRIVGSEVSATTSGNTLTLSVPATVRNGLVGNNTLFARVQDEAGAEDAASPAGRFGFVNFGSYIVRPQFAGSTNTAPTLGTMSPRAAFTVIPTTGVKLQTFVFYAKDEDGIGDLDSLWFMAGKQRDWTGSATFVFLPRTRRLYLRSDDGQSFLGGGQIGSAGSIENSQVKVDLSQVQFLIYGDGKSVGLRMTLQPKAGLIGQNQIWLRVQDNAGATSTGGDDVGFVQSGTWNVTRQSGSTVNTAAPSAPGS